MHVVWDLLRRMARRVAHWFGPHTRRRLALVAVALVGGWFGLLAGASSTQSIGPVEADFKIRPSVTGNAVVDVSPLGTLELDITDAPLAMDASVKEIRDEAAREILRDPNTLAGIEDRVIDDVRRAIVVVGLKAFGFAVLGSAIFTGAVFRDWRRILLGCGVSAGAILGAFGVAAATWNPKAIEEPRYTGILASAPRLVGSAETIAADFGEYRTQIAKLVTNLTRLYNSAADLPLSEPDPNSIGILHVSDIHLNPAAWNIIRSVKEQFGATMIIDTGDLVDQATPVENRVANEIGRLDVPYVFVKGNHDNADTVRAVARQDNGIVLDGKTRTVQGVRIWGIGDPRFQPDKLLFKEESDENLQAYGQQMRPKLQAAGPVDIATTHDPMITKEWDGLAPLTLAGHYHRRETEVQPGGTRHMMVGSTGGSGLRAVDNEEPSPIQLDMLYLDKETHRLKAWDEITLGGLGLTSAQLDRFTEEEPDRPLEPFAGQSPKPVPSPTPSGGKTPFTVPPSTPADTPKTKTSPRARRRRGEPNLDPTYRFGGADRHLLSLTRLR